MDNPPLPPEHPDSSSATKGIRSPATREEIEEKMRLVGRHFGKSKRRDFHLGANMGFMQTRWTAKFGEHHLTLKLIHMPHSESPDSGNSTVTVMTLKEEAITECSAVLVIDGRNLEK